MNGKERVGQVNCTTIVMSLGCTTRSLTGVGKPDMILYSTLFIVVGFRSGIYI